MKRLILWSIAFGITTLHAAVTDQQIANMFVLGFEGTHLNNDSAVIRDVCDRGLGGVILFKKNISNAQQLSSLTQQLGHCAHTPLIAVDQEGGTVRRIRFGQDYPRASQVAHAGTQQAKNIYSRMARELHQLGINYNLAPVADLSLEPKNYIINKLGRSYGKDPAIVRRYNSAFISAMHRQHILTALKHFPGHGSSLGDTHRGFVDVSKRWKPQELEPFKNRRADSVMVAHVVCDKVTEPGRPASLSPRAIGILRRNNPHTVVITDDLQMGAIRKQYGSLPRVIAMAINAGDDLLLFGNQLTRKNKVNLRQLIRIVRTLLAHNNIRASSIKAANRRIERMRKKIGLHNRKIPKHARMHKVKVFSSQKIKDMF